MDKELLLKRLSLIKFLFNVGLKQSYSSEPFSAFSILSFHDSIEMFLKLASELKGIQDCKNFMDYWEKIPELTLKEQIRNINNRRTNLKHKGLVPAHIEIESSRVNTLEFFEVHTPKLFGLQFNHISLFELIKFKIAKKYLIEAQNALDRNHVNSCVEEISKSFYELIYEYKSTKKDWINKTHFDLVEKINYPGRYSIGSKNIKDDFEALFEKVNKNFKSLESALEVIAMGIDYRKYMKFKILTPRCYRMSDGNYHVEIFGDKNWTKENCQFLIDFVLESALKLQEFNFSFESLDTSFAEFTLEIE